VFTVEQNLVEISAVMLVVFCRRPKIHTTRHTAIIWRHPQDRKYITHYTPPEEDWTYLIKDKLIHAGKFGKVRSFGFRVMRADRQTNIDITITSQCNSTSQYTTLLRSKNVVHAVVVCLSIRLFVCVCLSVCHIPVLYEKRRITQIMPHDRPGTLVFKLDVL